jgi:hypothetical protein
MKMRREEGANYVSRGKNKMSSKLELFYFCNNFLAGVEGLEPPNAWTKTMCLTSLATPQNAY